MYDSINFDYLRIGREMMKLQKEKTERYKTDRSVRLGDKYLLNNMCIYKKETRKNGAEWWRFYDKHYLTILHSHYPIRFWVPRISIIKHETEALNVPQTIILNEWAFENCYKFHINKCVANFGGHINTLLNYMSEDAPDYKYSPYKTIIDKLKIKRAVRDFIKNDTSD